jgi:hypothetical protein
MHVTNEMIEHTPKKIFFPLGEGVLGRIFFLVFPYVPNDVPQIINVFPKGVPNNTFLYPIPFAQSSPLLTYIGDQRRSTLSSHKNCYFGEHSKFQFFLYKWANQMGH